jgi:predicted nucleic acid-binding protein
MTTTERLATARSVFLDTAPVIYFIEQNPRYLPVLLPLFRKVDRGELRAVASPITLAECLVRPLKDRRHDLCSLFVNLLRHSRRTELCLIGADIAERGTQLRAGTGMALDDALQVSVALSRNCEIFLTNDRHLDRISELDVVLLDDLEGLGTPSVGDGTSPSA